MTASTPKHRSRSILGGVRAGSLGCVLALAAGSLWQDSQHSRDMPMSQGWMTKAIGLLLLGWLILVVVLVLRRRYRPTRLLTALAGALVAATGLASLAAGASWASRGPGLPCSQG